MTRKSETILRRTTDAIWGGQPEAMPRLQGALLAALRIALVLLRDLAQGQLTLRAMSLVYTTLLSIVPLLALSFSVLKTFGVYNQIQPMLLSFLEPLGEQGEEITRKIIGFIENINVGVLGSLGLALLIYTAVSVIQKIEESFNFIWHIRRPRRFGERFSRYLSVLLVGPILVFSAIGITATVLKVDFVRGLLVHEAFVPVVYAVGKVMPYLLVIGAFTFVYMFIPNTRVRLGPALAGGIVGGILWQTAGWAFAEFVASSGRYTAIYSSFAILILFMIWIYLSWLILLLGASVAFYGQHPQYVIAQSGEPRLSNRMRERLALAVMGQVAGSFLAGRPAPSPEQLSRAFRVPTHALQIALYTLERAGFITRDGNEPPAYLPARDASLISVEQLLQTVRAAGEEQTPGPDGLPVPAQVAQVLERLERAMAASVADLSARDLASAMIDEPAPGGGPGRKR